MDVPVIGLEASLLQVRKGIDCELDEVPDNVALCQIAFTSKSLSSAEWQYSNIERETLGILHGLRRFHHYCFAREVHVLTDDKPLVAIINPEDVALSQ